MCWWLSATFAFAQNSMLNTAQCYWSKLKCFSKLKTTCVVRRESSSRIVCRLCTAVYGIRKVFFQFAHTLCPRKNGIARTSFKVYSAKKWALKKSSRWCFSFGTFTSGFLISSKLSTQKALIFAASALITVDSMELRMNLEDWQSGQRCLMLAP